MASFLSPHVISKGHTSTSAGFVVRICSRGIFSSLFFSYPNFSLASKNTPISPPPLKTATTISPKHRILIAISISALILTWVLVMAYFKCFRFKIKRKIRHEEDEECSPPKTHVVDQPDSDRRPSSCGKSSVKRFGWDEIEKLSMNFNSVIGEGGFSTVYLAWFPDSNLGALKIHWNSERLSRVFKQELEVLMRVSHENIVKLLGYCDEREEGVLVFDYVPNGSLQDKLHGQGEEAHNLPWGRRMSIAFQLAQAIEYLHDSCDLQIIHSDIKASNVLLDEHFDCKLCDFGFAKMGFSSTILPSSATPMMGSPGYTDPHYLRTGIISKKNDVYSFGVLVLELITGIEAFCVEKEQLLTSIARPMLRDPTKAIEMVDSRLVGEFDAEEVKTMASISAFCLHEQPSLRPSMAEILRTMREKILSISFGAGKSKSKEISKEDL
ncbi:probable receptor-like protein kinase At4g10390 [Magnolia sinica]|uniref:probable receptor-like protein kinase At4g10390 n=1 Tax=Magnolia sinica TaxID=86752 RepID=UPI00265AF8B6|nr:probable receptor-like protein kinase At4g10390 [Magnolia sinica]